MKILSFNVNSLRAICSKFDLKEVLEQYNPDIIMFQELKFSYKEDNCFNYDDYENYINIANKKGYSGTMICTKEKPINVYYDLDGQYDDEGRIIILEYKNFFLINSYSPNSKRDLSRIPYRMEYDSCLANKMKELNKIKPVILAGDLNVAPEEIDLKNPKSNTRNAGFTIEERDSFKNLLEVSSSVDSFRYLYPTKVMYSWWSYIGNARSKGIGWRIDHFVVSSQIKDKIVDCEYLNEVYGSDHCPVLLTVDLDF